MAAAGGTLDFNRHFELETGQGTVRFNPSRDADLARLSARVDAVLRLPGDESKHARRGLEEMARLAQAALAAQPGPDKERVEDELVETACAVNNLNRPTIPRRFDVILLPSFLRQLFRPIGTGKSPANDLSPGCQGDLSRCDPLPSTFWSRPANIEAEDLYDGFGRTNLPSVGNSICHYSAPKETSGMNPGYEVKWGDQTVKLKFGEQSSEPAVTRFFWAMGFHTDPTDYLPGVKMAYDRRIFTEFNSRHPVRMKFTLLWFIPVYSMNLQRHADPFDYVAKAVLRDGRQWSGAELKRHLMDGTNFVSAVEAQIDYLVTTPANVQVKDERAKSIGPWDYGQLDHSGRRELRGAGLLAAWLGFYDTRFDNTKLRLVGPKKHRELVHYFSDLGGGLGRTTGLLSWHGENVNAFPWTFTAAPTRRHPLRIVGYSPIVRTAAFAAMTIDDARWMARSIGRLQVAQIRQALKAAGYDPPSVRLYTLKLVNRRNQMMADLGLDREFPPLAVNSGAEN